MDVVVIPTKKGVTHYSGSPQFYIHRSPYTNKYGERRYTIHLGKHKVVVKIKATTSLLGTEIKLGMVLTALWDRLEFEDPELFLYGGLVGWNATKFWEYSATLKNVLKTCERFGWKRDEWDTATATSRA